METTLRLLLNVPIIAQMGVELINPNNVSFMGYNATGTGEPVPGSFLIRFMTGETSQGGAFKDAIVKGKDLAAKKETNGEKTPTENTDEKKVEEAVEKKD